MSAGEREAIIEDRLKRATETYQDALILVANEHWHGAVNRLYYAVFYSANAFLAAHDRSAKTHKGVRQAFTLLIEETGAISRERTKIYHALFGFRHNSDYDDFVDMDRSRVEPLLAPAKELMDEIERILAKGQEP